MSQQQRMVRVSHFECNCKTCLSYRELPTKISVKNADVEDVDGEYYRMECEGDSTVYAKNGIWVNEQDCICIHYHPKQDGTINWTFWRNRREGKAQLLYLGPVSEENESQLLPPTIGWKNYSGQLVHSTLELSYKLPDKVIGNFNEKESHFLPQLDDGLLYSRARRLQCNNPKLQKITHPADQDKIYASMFRYLFSNPCDCETALTKVERDLQTASRKERYSALELVVWKAICRMHCPNNIYIYELLTWWESGWKKLKAELRHSREINIIMVHVLMFDEEK